MPVHDLGYRPWQGRRTPRILRPLFVAQSGVSLVWRRRWLRTMLMLAWLPIVFPAFGIFAFEYSSTEPGMQQFVVQLLSGPFQRPDLAMVALTDPDAVRHEIWTILILGFFRYPQLSAMVLLVGLIAPMLVSYDLRSKAYLLYFSRPLSPSEYILGKAAVVWFFLGVIVTVPAMILYVVGILLSPDLSVIGETWDIPIRVLLASIVLLVPTTALAMCYSSWTSESRYASFAWFATWILGFVAYQILTFMNFRPESVPRRQGEPDWQAMNIDFDRWRLLSPYHTLGKVEAWVFGLDPTAGSVWPAIGLLAAITVLGFWTVRRRIIARLSV
jgi:ABC-2 type transport system permease protein